MNVTLTGRNALDSLPKVKKRCLLLREFSWFIRNDQAQNQGYKYSETEELIKFILQI